MGKLWKIREASLYAFHFSLSHSTSINSPFTPVSSLSARAEWTMIIVNEWLGEAERENFKSKVVTRDWISRNVGLTWIVGTKTMTTRRWELVEHVAEFSEKLLRRKKVHEFIVWHYFICRSLNKNSPDEHNILRTMRYFEWFLYISVIFHNLFRGYALHGIRISKYFHDLIFQDIFCAATQLVELTTAS